MKISASEFSDISISQQDRVLISLALLICHYNGLVDICKVGIGSLPFDGIGARLLALCSLELPCSKLHIAKEFPEILNYDLHNIRKEISLYDLNQVVLAGVYSGYKAVTFEGAIRNCLYLGGNTEVTMPIAASISCMIGNKIEGHLKCFCNGLLSSKLRGYEKITAFI